TVLVTWAAVAVCLAGVALVFDRLPLAESGIRAKLGPTELLGVLAALLPLTLLTSSAQMLVATFARSFKEAQSYLQLLVIVPVIPGMLLMFMPVKAQIWMMLIPTFGQQVL